MKKTLLLIAITVLVVGGSVVGIQYLRNSQAADEQNEEAARVMSERTTEPEAEVEDTPESLPSEGVYAGYSEPGFDSTSGRRVLFFHAPWCAQCRMVEADIEQQGVPAGITVFKVDYDSNQALRQQYDVTLQTTFVEVDSDGNSTGSYVAYNEPTLDSVKRNLFDK